MRKTNYLILLTETERGMAEEALTHYIGNIFLGDGNWVSIDAREKCRAECVKALGIIKSFEGGIKKVCSETYLHFIKESLLWYANFIPVKKGAYMNEYVDLGYYVEGRNKNQELFNFDPNNYNPKEKKPFRTKDFTNTRYLIAREVDGKVNYISEIIQNENESTEDYSKRAEIELKQKKNETGKWYLVKHTDLPNLKLSKDCRYFCMNNDF